MSPNERRWFEIGCQSVLNELWNAISELEETRGKTAYGRGQLYVLRELVKKMDLLDPLREQEGKQ